MQKENLMTAIIGLANEAKTHKRIANLNNIISLCEMEEEDEEEKILFWNKLILANMDSIFDTYYRNGFDNAFVDGWLQAVKHLRMLIEDWEEIILEELEHEHNN